MNTCKVCNGPSRLTYCSQRCKDLTRRRPCAECGELMWVTGKGSLPVGQATCRSCRKHANPVATPRPVECAFCLASFTAKRRGQTWTACCSKSCGQKLRAVREGRVLGGDPEKRRANDHAKGYRRRARLRFDTDVTAAHVRMLRAKQKRCPLCTVKLIDAPYQPASKELDHIIPVNIGGTHTIGNVRIICRLCNSKRPYDGSDFVGQLTLWATDPDVVVKPAKPKKVKPPTVARIPKPPKPTPQPRPCRDCGAEIVPGGRGRPRSWCEECRPSEYLKRRTAA